MSNAIQHNDWMEVAETLQAVSDTITQLNSEFTFFHSIIKEWKLTKFELPTVSIVTRELEQLYVAVNPSRYTQLKATL